VQAVCLTPRVLLAARLRRALGCHAQRPLSRGTAAIRTAAGEPWQVRRDGAWRPVSLLRCWRGPAWLTLALAEPGWAGRPFHLTVWRCAAAGATWRRLCALAATAARTGRPGAP